jgi:hypothetical protein
MEKNPNLIKNGGKGTFVGNLLRGIVTIGKKVSPTLNSLLSAFDGSQKAVVQISDQLKKEDISSNDLVFLLAELDKDKLELEQITNRWVSDNLGSWLSRNVRPITLLLYNFNTFFLIYLDSYSEYNFEVKQMWINILLTNTGLINTAYFGSRYLEKRDTKKYK